MQYFRLEQQKPQRGSLAKWGRSLWWYEIDDQAHTARKIIMFEVGTVLKYDQEHQTDEFDRLIDREVHDAILTPITEDQFRTAWSTTGASNRPWPSPDHPPATLATHGWELESALERHQKSPETFAIVTHDEIAELKIGDLVKLLVAISGENERGPHVAVERLWVAIAVIAEGRFLGALLSRPVTSEALLPGDMIAFDVEHIVSV